MVIAVEIISFSFGLICQNFMVWLPLQLLCKVKRQTKERIVSKESNLTSRDFRWDTLCHYLWRRWIGTLQTNLLLLIIYLFINGLNLSWEWGIMCLYRILYRISNWMWLFSFGNEVLFQFDLLQSFEVHWPDWNCFFEWAFELGV